MKKNFTTLLLSSSIIFIGTTLCAYNVQASSLNITKNSAAYSLNTYKVSGSSQGEALVTYAEIFIGIPYVYGGASPSGFDCSGFVQYCYNHFGVKLPRTTYDQVNIGTTVTGNIMPRDLLFFGSVSLPDHVAIYVGNGCMIESSKTGDVVHITPIRAYCIAKRIFK
ncbi:C40 family peptidase [Clostridium felsineum]|uniref:C40 family peptidase n=1 Tax=Clostridium felsineum TaxID=36839 RepID=UPI0009D2F980|nr:C40 family peptidase [Clostridium felsineum]URZ03655.1 Gamma-DL-glutamyl hydrolase [Clostridium felsineum]